MYLETGMDLYRYAKKTLEKTARSYVISNNHHKLPDLSQIKIQ